MAQTPFSTQSVTYQGAAPSFHLPGPDIRPKRLWLGQPGNMVELPSPSKQSFAAPRIAGTVTHQLYGGGTAVTNTPNTARQWTYTWTALNDRDWSVLAAVHNWSLSTPPWIMIPLEVKNLLTGPQSCFQQFSWHTAGALAADTTPPYILPAALPSSYATWTISSSAQFMQPGLSTALPDVTTATPVVGALSFCFSVWVKAITGTPSVTPVIESMNADGTIVATQTGTAFTTTTSWSRIQVLAGPGSLSTGLYVQPRVTTSSTSGTVQFSNAALSPTTAPVGWVQGEGAPRVNLITDMQNQYTGSLRHDEALTFAEANPQGVLL